MTNIICISVKILSRVGGVSVTKLTGPRSDDWIYQHFGYKFLVKINTALSLIYSIYSSPLHMH
jgi:hypothetical protein